MKWTKEDRAPFIKIYCEDIDTIEEYIDELVEIWHDYYGDWLISGEVVSLYDFLGLEDHEITLWVREGKVPERIERMWTEEAY